MEVFLFLCQVFIGELHRWGLPIDFRGHEKVYFWGIRHQGCFGWTIEALSDARYRVEFRHTFRHFLFVVKNCYSRKSSAK